MAVRYDVYENPNADPEDNQSGFHVRVITDGTITTDELAEKIHYGSSMTVGDVKSVLSNLGYFMGDLLGQGKRVHVEGLGYFQMTLECDPVDSAKKVRADAVRFKSVSFRPEKALKIELQKTRFVRSRKKIHSLPHTEETIDELLTEYFKEHVYITRTQFGRLFGFTSTTALRRIKVLVEQGKLKKEGGGSACIYLPLAYK